jgi:hypothetical protein
MGDRFGQSGAGESDGMATTRYFFQASQEHFPPEAGGRGVRSHVAGCPVAGDAGVAGVPVYACAVRIEKWQRNVI